MSISGFIKSFKTLRESRRTKGLNIVLNGIESYVRGNGILERYSADESRVFISEVVNYLQDLMKIDKMGAVEITNVFDIFPVLAATCIRGIVADLVDLNVILQQLRDRKAKIWECERDAFNRCYYSSSLVSERAVLSNRFYADDLQIEHFDAYFSICSDLINGSEHIVLRFINYLQKMDNPVSKISGDVLGRTVEKVIVMLKDDPNMENRAHSIFLGLAMKAIHSPKIRTQLFAANTLALLRNSDSFRLWCIESRPLLSLMNISTHDQVLTALKPAISVIARHSSITKSELETIAGRVTESDVSQHLIFASLVAEAMKGVEEDVVAKFIEDEMIGEEVTRGTLRFLGLCCVSLCENAALVSLITNFLLDEFSDIAITTLREIGTANASVSKCIVLEALERQTTDEMWQLVGELIEKCTVVDLDDVLLKLQSLWQNVPMYYELLKIILKRIRIPLNEKFESFMEIILQTDSEAAFDALRVAYGYRGVQLFRMNFYLVIIQVFLDLQLTANEMMISLVTDILLGCRMRATSTALMKAFCKYAIAVMLVLVDFFDVESESIRKVAFEKIMVLYRGVSDEVAYVVIAGLCQTFSKGYRYMSEFICKFIDDYEAIIDESVIHIKRHKELKNNRNIKLTLTSPEVDTVVPIRVSKSTMLIDLYRVASELLNTYSDSIILSKTYQIPITGTVGDTDIANGDVITVSRTHVFLRSIPIVHISHSLSQLPGIQMELFNALSSPECTTRNKKYIWKLLQRIPTIEALEKKFSDSEMVVKFLSSNKNEYHNRYVYQIMKLKIECGRDYCMVYPILFEKLAIGELNIDLLELVNTPEAIQYLEYDEGLMLTLTYKLEEASPKLQRHILAILSALAEKSPQAESVLLNADFIDILVLDSIPVTENIFDKFRDKTAIFEKLVLLFKRAVESEQVRDSYFKFLLDVYNTQCDARDILCLAGSLLAEDFSIPALRFITRVIEMNPEYAFSNVDVLEMLLTMIFREGRIAICTEIYDFCRAMMQQSAVSRSLVLNALQPVMWFQTDRWRYTCAVEKQVDIRGLRNLGTTCYMNCILQQIFFNDKAREAVLASAKTIPVVLELKNMFIRMALSLKSQVDTERFVQVWARESPSGLDMRTQEDAVEFMQKLFDHLPPEITVNFQVKLVREFEGIKEKEFKREVPELLHCLPIPVANMTSFAEAMKTYTEPRIMTGSEQYVDEQLGKIDVRMSERVVTLPNTLVIQLERFHYDLKTYRRMKIPTKFEFPAEFKASSFFEGHNALYRLKGVVTHSGTAEGGHYNSLILCNGSWYHLNDSETAKVTNSMFKTYVNGNGDFSSCAYLLFYDYVGPEDTEVCDHGTSMELVKAHVHEQAHKNDLSAIIRENEYFTLCQALFDTSTFNFLINGTQFDLIWNYFYRVWCHSCLTDMTSVITNAIMEMIPDNLEFAISWIEDQPDVICDVFAHADADIISAVIDILELIFQFGAPDRLLCFGNWLIETAMEHISQWRVIENIGQAIYAYVDARKVDLVEPLVSLIIRFYKTRPGPVARSKVNMSYLFNALGILVEVFEYGVVEDLIEYEGVINQSEYNTASYQALASKRAVVYQTMDSSSIADVLESAQSSETVMRLWNSPNFPEVLETASRSVLLKWPKETLFTLITSEHAWCRELGEDMFLTLFPDMDGLDCDKIETLPYDCFVEHYEWSGSQSSLSETTVSEAMTLYQIGYEFMQENLVALPKRLCNLIRVLMWFRLHLQIQNLDSFGHFLLTLDSVIPGENYDVITLLQLISFADRAQTTNFFCNHMQDLLGIIRTGLQDTGWRMMFLAHAFRSCEAFDMLISDSRLEELSADLTSRGVTYPFDYISHSPFCDKTRFEVRIIAGISMVLRDESNISAIIRQDMSVEQRTRVIVASALLAHSDAAMTEMISLVDCGIDIELIGLICGAYAHRFYSITQKDIELIERLNVIVPSLSKSIVIRATDRFADTDTLTESECTNYIIVALYLARLEQSPEVHLSVVSGIFCGIATHPEYLHINNGALLLDVCYLWTTVPFPNEGARLLLSVLVDLAFPSAIVEPVTQFVSICGNLLPEDEIIEHARRARELMDTYCMASPEWLWVACVCLVFFNICPISQEIMKEFPLSANQIENWPADLRRQLSFFV